MNLFENDLSETRYLILMILFMLITIVGRYFIIAGIFHLYFYKLNQKKWEAKKINIKQYPKNQLRREMLWSIAAALLFSITGAFTVLGWQKGYTKFYLEVEKYGWFYLPISLALILFIHETYYYWIHRLMHHPSIYKFVHKIHHDSKIPSPFTAFSFHPLEGVLQAIILPVLLIIIPIHYYVLMIYLLIMTFSSVINHLDIDIYPKGFEKHWLGKWLIGAAHHSLHHGRLKYNFGLYFTFWDKFFKTENPQSKIFLNQELPNSRVKQQ